MNFPLLALAAASTTLVVATSVNADVLYFEDFEASESFTALNRVAAPGTPTGDGSAFVGRSTVRAGSPGSGTRTDPTTQVSLDISNVAADNLFRISYDVGFDRDLTAEDPDGSVRTLAILQFDEGSPFFVPPAVIDSGASFAFQTYDKTIDLSDKIAAGATEITSVRLRFFRESGPDDANSIGTFVDNVAIEFDPIPEPGAASLLLVGLAAAARRRRS